MAFNIAKCRAMHLGKRKTCHNYTMNCVVLGKTEEKDINMKSLQLTAQCVKVHERQEQF